MSEAASRALEVLTRNIGVEEPPGAYLLVDQNRINVFAETTLDRQFIHVDPVKAAQTQFKTTIAHGFLSLSLITHLTESIPPMEPDPFAERVMGINYGLDRVRFTAPVPVNSRIRARRMLLSADPKGDKMIQLTHRITLEIEGERKPVCLADWITLAIYE
jgi:acyl dehydratase